MKKSIALFGGYYFNTIEYNEGEIIPVFNSEYLTLASTNNVTNYTFYDKPISYHYEFIEKLVEIINVDEAILAFGDYESEMEVLDNFVISNYQSYFSKIVEVLVNKGIDVKIRLLKEDDETKIALNKAMIEVLDKNIKLKLSKNYSNLSLCLV